MSGAGESPRVPPEAQSQDIAGMTSDIQPLGTRAQAQAWWDTLLESEKTRRLADAQVDGFGLTCTTANLAPRTLILLYGRSLTLRRPGSGIGSVRDAAVTAITAANAQAARLGGDGEPYPEDVAIPVPIRGGLSGKAPYSPTPEQKPQIDAALRRQMSEDWPTIEQQTKCWPPKSKAEEERAVMSDARATVDLAALAGDEVDWTPLAYRLARIPKAREAIFAAMDVEGRPWRWADTVVIAIFALVFMATGAAALAIAAKLAS